MVSIFLYTEALIIYDPRFSVSFICFRNADKLDKLTEKS